MIAATIFLHNCDAVRRRCIKMNSKTVRKKNYNHLFAFLLRRRKFTSCFDARVHSHFTPTARAKQNVWPFFRAATTQTVSQISNPIYLEFISSYAKTFFLYAASIAIHFLSPVQGFSPHNVLWDNILNYCRLIFTPIKNAYIQLISIVCNGLWLICREKLTIYLKSYGDACGYVWSATRE